jgi:hypothetical protein
LDGHVEPVGDPLEDLKGFDSRDSPHDPADFGLGHIARDSEARLARSDVLAEQAEQSANVATAQRVYSIGPSPESIGDLD